MRQPGWQAVRAAAPLSPLALQLEPSAHWPTRGFDTHTHTKPHQTKPTNQPTREEIGAPGMVVLQFAWGGGTNNVHLPHMHYQNSFCYPGTHDNETAVGWFADSANEQVRSLMLHVCVCLCALKHSL